MSQIMQVPEALETLRLLQEQINILERERSACYNRVLETEINAVNEYGNTALLQLGLNPDYVMHIEGMYQIEQIITQKEKEVRAINLRLRK